jgi:hypothetical protein
MLTLIPTPCPIETLADQIATTVFTTNRDVEAREQLKRQLMQFAAEIQRQAHA